MSSRRSAFTLIELLVVIAIIALLISILLPSLRQAKDLAKAVVCQTRMKGLYNALVLYAEDWDGCIMRAGSDTRYAENEDGDRVEVTAYWTQHMTAFEERDFPAGMAYWTPPVEYIENRELYMCPSRDRDGEYQKAARDWPWGYGLSAWQCDILGSYGLNNRMAHGYNNEGAPPLGYGAPSNDAEKTHYPLFRTRDADKMYLAAETFLQCFDHCNNTEFDFWYEPRHGAKRDYVHVLFHDGHIEPIYANNSDDLADNDFPESLDPENQYRLPWWNEPSWPG